MIKNTMPLKLCLKISDIITHFTSELTKAGIANAHNETRQMIVDAIAIRREDFILNPQMILTRSQIIRLESWLKRRLSGEPLARIRGGQEFYGRKFMLSSATLEPRPDSETLIDAALQVIDTQRGPANSWRILDVGTGTGCLVLTLLAERCNTTAIGVDICNQALVIAQQNATSLGIEDRVTWLQSNYLDQVTGEFDLLISNPPYIKSADICSLQTEVVGHDPHLALEGGLDGLDAYRYVKTDLFRVLPKGFAIFETACNDCNRVISILNAGTNHNWLSVLGTRQDLAGCERCIILETFSRV